MSEYYTRKKTVKFYHDDGTPNGEMHLTQEQIDFYMPRNNEKRHRDESA